MFSFLKKAKPALNTIGFFQFENLIRNRVPFTLYNMGPDLSDWYDSLYKTHLQKHQILLPQGSVMADITEKKHATTSALILVCQDGKQSSDLFFELINKGYTNVYVVDGGYQQMMTEKGSS